MIQAVHYGPVAIAGDERGEAGVRSE